MLSHTEIFRTWKSLAALPISLAFIFISSSAFAADAKIDSGDTAWMLTSTGLVLLMTIPGLALFYAGLVRRKNIIATAMQSFIIACLVCVLWAVCGYGLAFMNGVGKFAPYFGD